MTGIVIDGLCRDTGHLSKLPIPVYSRGCTPHAAGASLPPIVQVPVLLGGVEIRPGDILLGDNDGILVASETELLGVIDAAEAIQSREQDLRSAVEGGESLFAQLNFDEHVAALSAGRESALAFA
jgi:regulator of RNase E activity RraA